MLRSVSNALEGGAVRCAEFQMLGPAIPPCSPQQHGTKAVETCQFAQIPVCPWRHARQVRPDPVNAGAQHAQRPFAPQPDTTGQASTTKALTRVRKGAGRRGLWRATRAEGNGRTARVRG